MTKIKETNEPLEDEHPVPEDASEEEQQRLREENEKIRDRNDRRKANATAIGEQFGAARYINNQQARDSVPPGQQGRDSVPPGQR